jgi:hypothetical protein
MKPRKKREEKKRRRTKKGGSRRQVRLRVLTPPSVSQEILCIFFQSCHSASAVLRRAVPRLLASAASVRTVLAVPPIITSFEAAT